MIANGFRLARIRGIEVKVDFSWLLIVALVTWSFWARFSLERDGAALPMAVTAALLFFGSILAHELAHAFEATRRGVEVKGITLFVFGGATETTSSARRPVDEFALTAVGPLTSLGLAAALGAASFGATAAGWDAAAAVAGLVAWLNLALGLFNLLPGAPLDGGRILRSAVWKATGDRVRSARVAAGAGQVLGGLMIALGVLQLVTATRVLVDGLWLAFIGWFLLRAAGAERAQAELEARLRRVRTSSLVGRGPEPIPADVPVRAAVDHWFRAYDADVFPVVDGDKAVGVFGVGELRGVPAGEQEHTTVGDVMRPLADVPRVDADGPGTELLDPLRRHGVVLAMRGGRVVGLVTPGRLAVVLERADLLEDRRRGVPA